MHELPRELELSQTFHIRQWLRMQCRVSLSPLPFPHFLPPNWKFRSCSLAGSCNSLHSSGDIYIFTQTYVCIYTHTHIYVYTHWYIYIYIYKHIYVYTDTCISMYLYNRLLHPTAYVVLYIYICMYAYIYVYMNTYIYINIYIYTYISMYV